MWQSTGKRTGERTECGNTGEHGRAHEGVGELLETAKNWDFIGQGESKRITAGVIDKQKGGSVVIRISQTKLVGVLSYCAAPQPRSDTEDIIKLLY